MKRFIIFIVIANIAIGLFAQSDFYYSAKGERENFEIRKDKVIIKTKSDTDAKELCKQNVFLAARDVAFVWVLATIDPSKTSLNDLMQIPEVVDVTYGLEYTDGTLQYPSDQIFIKCKSEQTVENILDNRGLSKNVEAIELFNPRTDLYLVTLNVELSDILRKCRDLFESGLCKSADPSFYLEMKPHNTYFSNQWGLKQNSGIDIKAEQAWQITRGSNEIRVAVIDEGVNLNHLDLQANLQYGFDATVGAPGGANGSPFGTNAHGTACAGIIGAINNTIGIVGVAPNVRIIPIRIAYDNTGTWTTNNTWIANGINHAWQTANADVLSNSWGNFAYNSGIDDAITDAVNNGRLKNGVRLGCVVVAASGNNNLSTVSFPAYLPNVIAVGAMDRNGQRSIWTGGQGSNFGAALDVVAPGTDIYTTGIAGATGYGTVINNNGIYFSGFSGTSAACPHVSGIAALILSANPNLRQDQVRNAIETTCTRLSAHPATGTGQNGRPRDDQTGYGLVDAYAAISVILRISGPSNICSSGSFTVSNAPQGFTWDKSSNLSLSSTTASTITVTKISDGQGWVSVKSSSGVELAKVNVFAGSPALVFIYGPDQVGSSGTFYAGYTGGATVNSFNWQMRDEYNASYFIINNGHSSAYIDCFYYPQRYYYLKVTVGNSCGFSTSSEFQIYATGRGGGSSYSYYPNPVSDVLFVEITQENINHVKALLQAAQRSASNLVFDIRLYDESGVMQRQTSTSRVGTVEFNVSGLPDGNYFLHIYDGTGAKPYMKQIVVQH